MTRRWPTERNPKGGNVKPLELKTCSGCGMPEKHAPGADECLKCQRFGAIPDNEKRLKRLAKNMQERAVRKGHNG